MGMSSPDNPVNGDDKPQKATIELKDDNLKFIFGASRDFGAWEIYAAYSASEFNLFTAGVLYRFDIK